VSSSEDVRKTLSAYHAACRQIREIELDKPKPNEPGYIRESYDRLSQAAAVNERMVRDDLCDAVVLFTGKAPSAVIVDSVGGSSIVAVSNTGTPEGMIVATAPDRVRIKEFVRRPERPPEFAHEWRQLARNQAGNYVVMQCGDVVAIYNGVYFQSTNEVVADFQALIQAGFEGVWSDDYVIWCDGRIMALIHRSMDRQEQKIFLFNKPHNDPIAGRVIDPMPYWPTQEAWVEAGRGDLWSGRCDR
jgi:hypothetical protein